MVDIIGDLKQEILELKRRLHVLESASPLGQSSVSEGALEIRSEEGLIVIGSIRISGVMNGDGTITWTGPWNLTGLGTVTGDADWSGDLNLTGNIKVLAGGKITVGAGGAQIVIDGATGKITAGNMTIDPTVSGGAVTFANGAQVFTDASTVQVFKGSSVAQVSNDYARLQHGGSVIEINGSGMRASLGAVAPISGTGAVARTVMQDTNGYFRRADGT